MSKKDYLTLAEEIEIPYSCVAECLRQSGVMKHAHKDILVASKVLVEEFAKAGVDASDVLRIIRYLNERAAETAKTELVGGNPDDGAKTDS